MADNTLPGRYFNGTASVDAGGTVVTPTGATWTGNVWGDDLFFLPSQRSVPPQRIESVNEDGELVLAYPWPGAAATEEQYEVRFVGIIERSTAQSRRVLEQLGDVKAWYDIIVEDDAARLALESSTSPLRAGYRVLVKADGVIWAKETSAYGEWIGPVEFKGDQGSKGWSPQIVAEDDGARRVLKLAGYVGGEGVVPTENVGKYFKGDGTWTSTIGDAADFRGEGFIFMGAYNGATDYDKGNVARDNGSSWIALQPTTGNAPPIYPTTSNAFWALLSAKGQDGTGTGDVVGPASAINERIAVWDGLTGKLLKDGGKTIAQILAEAIPAGYDDLQLTVSQIALAMADALNVAQFLGPNGNRFADSFDALIFVDVAGATNLDTSAAGVLKPTLAAGADQTATHTGPTTAGNTVSASSFLATPGYPGWQAFDKVVGGTVGAGNWITNSITIGWLQYQFASAKTIVSYSVRSSNGYPTRSPSAWTLQGSNTGAFTGEQVILDTRAGQVGWSAGGSVVTYTIASPASFAYYRLNVTANNGDGTYLQIDEMTLVAAGIPNNLTVRSAAFTASAVPDKMKALINVKEVDAAGAGTDYTLECSRDNGSTWTAMTLTERYTMPTTGLRVVEAAETDVSGQPSGTAPRWRFKTLNSKNVELHDVYLYWS